MAQITGPSSSNGNKFGSKGQLHFTLRNFVLTTQIFFQTWKYGGKAQNISMQQKFSSFNEG
jgi:hypothetical protein